MTESHFMCLHAQSLAATFLGPISIGGQGKWVVSGGEILHRIKKAMEAEVRVDWFRLKERADRYWLPRLNTLIEIPGILMG